MAFKYDSGLETVPAASNASNSFMYLRGGIIINIDDDQHIIKYDSKLQKFSGKNYIYADTAGNLYSSSIQRLDSLIKIVYMDKYLKLESEELNDPNAAVYNAAVENIQNSVGDIVATLKAELDAKLAEALSVDPYDDTVLMVKAETKTVSGDKLTMDGVIYNAISLYVLGKGELELTSISSINQHDIILGDSSMDGEQIEVAYNSLTNI